MLPGLERLSLVALAPAHTGVHLDIMADLPLERGKRRHNIKGEGEADTYLQKLTKLIDDGLEELDALKKPMPLEWRYPLADARNLAYEIMYWLSDRKQQDWLWERVWTSKSLTQLVDTQFNRLYEAFFGLPDLQDDIRLYLKPFIDLNTRGLNYNVIRLARLKLNIWRDKYEAQLKEDEEAQKAQKAYEARKAKEAQDARDSKPAPPPPARQDSSDSEISEELPMPWLVQRTQRDPVPAPVPVPPDVPAAAAGKRRAESSPSEFSEVRRRPWPAPQPLPLPLLPAVQPRAGGAGPRSRSPTPEEEDTDTKEGEGAHTQGNLESDTQPADELHPYDWSLPALSSDPDVAWDNRFWNQHRKEGGRTLGRDPRYGDYDAPVVVEGELEELKRQISKAEHELAQGNPETKNKLEVRLAQLREWLALLPK